MTIKDIIGKHYEEFHKTCSADKVVSQGRTEEDILNDVCITACRKFKSDDITEEDGLNYLTKNLKAEKYFQYHRKKGELVVYMDHPESLKSAIIFPPEIE